MSAAAESEWPYLRGALVALLAIVAVELGGWLVYRSVHHGTPPYVLTVRCLTREKHLEVRSASDDPSAKSARGGALATRVEGNGVHVAIARSESEASRIAESYRLVGGALTGRLEQRGKIVYLWDAAASPTARQTMYDCFYD